MMNDLNWQQIKVLTVANMKARYRKTMIGFFWVVLGPILMYSVQAFVFQKFLKLELHNYYLFLLGGLLPWIFITSSWDSCTPVMVSASSILKSFQISPLIILASAIIENFINFITAFILIVIPTLIYSQEISLNLIFLPLSLLLLMAFTFITTAIFAILHVFYRDIKYVTNFSMSLLFFLTPIFYPTNFVPDQYKWIIQLNPLFLVIAPFRASLYGGETIEIIFMLIKAVALTFVVALIFIKIWKAKKNELFLKL